jgi:hypothetical protein
MGYRPGLPSVYRGLVTLSAVQPGEPLAEWVTPCLTLKRGRDPLGLQTITLDRIMPVLLPGVLALSQRARYLAIYPFLLAAYEERRLAESNGSLGEFIRLREYELCLAMQLCPRDCGAASAIGSERARPDARQLQVFPRRESVESSMGGYGLYYRSPLVDLDVVIPAGARLGDTTTGVDVLARSDHARALADAFREAIKDTQYAKLHMNGVDPIPRPVLTELAVRACLCRLDERPAERQAIHDALFGQARPERTQQVEQRRRAFAVFLSQLSADPDVASQDGPFRRGIIDTFHADPAGTTPRAEAHASWAGLAMKECVQEAICSLWTDFCRRGLHVQAPDGMTRSELHQFITEELTAAGSVELGDTTVTWEAEQALGDFRDAVLTAASMMHWEDVRAWTHQQNTAMSGLAALAWFEARSPKPGSVSPSWQWPGLQDSDHQAGYLRTVGAFRGALASNFSIAEALEWALRTFVIGPHEIIAYSKLPDSTFRFCWEEGRLRFYPAGHDRFTVAGARRSAMSSLSQDLGLWTRAGNDGTPQLTGAGKAFISQVFR